MQTACCDLREEHYDKTNRLLAYKRGSAAALFEREVNSPLHVEFPCLLCQQPVPCFTRGGGVCVCVCVLRWYERRWTKKRKQLLEPTVSNI